LTLRLVDRAGTYDRVFPVGVGAINDDSRSSTYQESLSYFPVWKDHTQDFSIDTTNNWSFNPCRVWWTSSDTGERLPVFAGLPFMRFRGSYGIHGPIDNYRAANGGNLRRGYVSHGCVRMEARDVVEVYARIRGVDDVPVHVQREAERLTNGTRADVEERWIGDSCTRDEDCNYEGGLCKLNAYSGRGFCSARCDRYCDDRANHPGTFCVADPDAPGEGMCVPRQVDFNADCRSYDHMTPQTLPRHNQPWRSQTVCAPGTRGWIGDRCFDDGECFGDLRCSGDLGGGAGLCTQSCERFCPDQNARPTTFCARPHDGDAASCLRKCSPDENGAGCAEGTTCVRRARASDPNRTDYVCVPN
jgi:hypothetical protein